MDDRGLFTFPGIQQIVAGRYTLSHGVTPQAFALEINPQENFTTLVGPVSILRAGAPPIVFRDCRLDTHNVRRDSRGRYIGLSILDRRWKWRFAGRGPLWGTFNERDDRGQLKTSRRVLASDLVELCLRALGEVDYEVLIPDEVNLLSNPYAEWSAASPAEALAELCDQIGCRVVPRTDGRVGIYPLGLGAELPREDIKDESVTLDLPERPDAIKVVCGVNRFEGIFSLRAVGDDGYNSYFPQIDNLSYNPSGARVVNGWDAVKDPTEFKGIANLDDRERAKRSVWRWYQIDPTQSVLGAKPLRILGFQAPGSPKGEFLPAYLDHLEIDGVRLKTKGGNPFWTRENALPAEVWGRWWPGDLKHANSLASSAANIGSVTAAGTAYANDFEVDTHNKMVKFPRQVFKLVAGTGTNSIIRAADLGLRCACSVKRGYNEGHSGNQGWWDRFEHERRLPGQTLGTGPLVIQAPDAVRNLWWEIDAKGKRTGQPQGNEDEVKRYCDYMIAAALASYQLTPAQQIVYRGFKDISPDGAIQQVQWQLSEQGAVTIASRQAEFSHAVAPYKERRRMEQLAHDFRTGSAHFRVNGWARSPAGFLAAGRQP